MRQLLRFLSLLPRCFDCCASLLLLPPPSPPSSPPPPPPPPGPNIDFSHRQPCPQQHCCRCRCCCCFSALDTTKDPCQNVKCSRHKVCVAQGYQRAMCVNRKKLEQRYCVCVCVCVCVGTGGQVLTLTLRYLGAASAKSLLLSGHRLEMEARSRVNVGRG